MREGRHTLESHSTFTPWLFFPTACLRGHTGSKTLGSSPSVITHGGATHLSMAGVMVRSSTPRTEKTPKDKKNNVTNHTHNHTQDYLLGTVTLPLAPRLAPQPSAPIRPSRVKQTCMNTYLTPSLSNLSDAVTSESADLAVVDSTSLIQPTNTSQWTRYGNRTHLTTTTATRRQQAKRHLFAMAAAKKVDGASGDGPRKNTLRCIYRYSYIPT